MSSKPFSTYTAKDYPTQLRQFLPYDLAYDYINFYDGEYTVDSLDDKGFFTVTLRGPAAALKQRATAAVGYTSPAASLTTAAGNQPKLTTVSVVGQLLPAGPNSKKITGPYYILKERDTLNFMMDKSVPTGAMPDALICHGPQYYDRMSDTWKESGNYKVFNSQADFLIMDQYQNNKLTVRTIQVGSLFCLTIAITDTVHC